MVILDICMPKVDGVDAYKAMKEINPNIKVVFCSGHDLPGKLKENLEGDLYTFIRKPYVVNEFLEAVIPIAIEESAL